MDLSDVQKKIVRQLEYYFHDLNLCRDHFLKGVIAENEGWVDMDTMLKFKRLSSLSEDKEVILEALKKSSSELLEVGEKGIRRNPELKIPDNIADVNSAYEDQCLYVKGFPVDLSLDEIIEYFEKNGFTTLNICMRRFPQASFKGSIFVTFKSKEDAEKFLNSEECQKYNNTDLIKKWRRVYFSDKRAERELHTDQNSKRKGSQSDRDANVVSRMTHGALLELSGLPSAVSRQNAESEKAMSESEETDGERSVAGRKRKADDKGPTEKTGMHVSDLKNWIKEQLEGISVAWVDVFPAESRAVVRFKEANSADNAWNRLIEKNKPPVSKDNDENVNVEEAVKVMYMGHSLSGRVLSDNEEVQYWKTIFASINRKNSNRDRGASRGRSSFPKRRAY